VSKCPGGHCPGCGSGGFPWGLLVGLVAAVAVALFVFAHLVFIAVGLAVTGVVTGGFVLVLRRFAIVDWAPRRERLAVTATASARPIAARDREAIEAPAQHLHLHLHLVSAEEAAAIISRRDSPAWPAVGDDPSWASPSS
jgi:hypothetical protein